MVQKIQGIWGIEINNLQLLVVSTLLRQHIDRICEFKAAFGFASRDFFLNFLAEVDVLTKIFTLLTTILFKENGVDKARTQQAQRSKFSQCLRSKFFYLKLLLPFSINSFTELFQRAFSILRFFR